MNFEQTRAQFNLPDNLIYLDGNSLGPLPIAAAARIQDTVTNQWGKLLIRGWNEAGWMQQPRGLGDRIGRLIGADAGSVMVGDTLSIKVYQALASALKLNNDRKVVLSDSGNFPTDLYMAQGLLDTLDNGHQLTIVEPEQIEAAINTDVAVLMLTQVDYRSGRLHDMVALTRLAHEHGCIVIWDLAHSAGAVPVALAECNAEFAVGCTYKYLNAGPGAPAFIYVRPDIVDQIEPALAGWLGHHAPFAFEPTYRPGDGIDRMRVGTPSVIQMAALDAALAIWDKVGMQDVREKSIALTELFIRLVEQSCPELTLASPRDPSARGSQVSFSFHQGYAVMQALISKGVIGDFRAPDIMRFGFTPLYINEDDVAVAATVIEKVMSGRLWDQEEYKHQAAVT